MDRSVQVETGTLVADAVRAAEIDLGLPCGGQGRCGRCTVIVREGEVQRPPNQRLSGEDRAAGYALACQATIEGDATIYVPPQRIERVLETDKTATEVQVPLSYDVLRDQPLRKYVVSVSEPSLDDQTDDWSRLKRELARQHDVQELIAELPVLRRLSGALRDGEHLFRHP